MLNVRSTREGLGVGEDTYSGRYGRYRVTGVDLPATDKTQKGQADECHLRRTKAARLHMGNFNVLTKVEYKSEDNCKILYFNKVLSVLYKFLF